MLKWAHLPMTEKQSIMMPNRVKFQAASYDTFWNVNYYLVWILVKSQTDRQTQTVPEFFSSILAQTDRQTDSQMDGRTDGDA